MRRKSVHRMRTKRTIQEENNNARILQLMSRYLNNAPDFIKKEAVEDIAVSCHVTTCYAFQVLLAAACDLDTEENLKDRALFYKYFPHMIQELDNEEFLHNPYYHMISFPSALEGDCQLMWQKYQAYEAFVCDDFKQLEDGRLLPQIGYFKKEFAYPAILEQDRIWMTVTPNEIATMRKPIEKAFGHVLTFGLGLGYYAYMVSCKPEVDSVTIVEVNPKVISLFQQYILPQFPQKQKIHIVQAEALSYARAHLADGLFDVVFTDLWHDASDGIPLYLQMKSLEPLAPGLVYLYWIEDTMRYYL